MAGGTRRAFERYFPHDIHHRSDKDDHRTVDIRATASVAVIPARKLVADGFAVSITALSGHLYLADQFNLLLPSKSLNSQGMTDDG
jgi:hypothetical protein